MRQYDDYEEYEDYEDIEEDTSREKKYSSRNHEEKMITIFSFISTWFIRIGIAIAAILLIVFFVTGKVLTALFYIIGLVVSFLCGYGFMYLLDRIETSD